MNEHLKNSTGQHQFTASVGSFFSNEQVTKIGHIFYPWASVNNRLWHLPSGLTMGNLTDRHTLQDSKQLAHDLTFDGVDAPEPSSAAIQTLARRLGDKRDFTLID